MPQGFEHLRRPWTSAASPNDRHIAPKGPDFLELKRWRSPLVLAWGDLQGSARFPACAMLTSVHRRTAGPPCPPLMVHGSAYYSLLIMVANTLVSWGKTRAGNALLSSPQSAQAHFDPSALTSMQRRSAVTSPCPWAPQLLLNHQTRDAELLLEAQIHSKPFNESMTQNSEKPSPKLGQS